ncbi:MAG TPA: nucleotidyltransferase family protein [Chthonomonadaceae bacterium]|nr:nucleotidyltransferase family protein [Chthonomonadaceae bacterium]
MEPQDSNQRQQLAGSVRERVDIVLPAGGRISGEFARIAGTEIKALIHLGGQTLLQRAIEVFRATGRVERIVVVGPEAALAEARAAGVEGAILEGVSGPENFLRGLQWLQEQNGGHAPRALLSTTDLPFLTPEAINAYLDACPPQADVAVPVITRQAFEARFPGTQNIFVPLREGAITIGCVFLINPETLLNNRPHIERIFQARKSQWQMARLVGWRTVARFATRQLTIRAIEERCGQILGCTGVGVRDCAPELGFDIDLPQEYEYARAYYAHQAALQAHLEEGSQPAREALR